MYNSKPIEIESINQIIESAIWAPLGKNGQSWKFKIITDKNIIEEISKLSANSRWLKAAPCLIIVYLDKMCSYHYIKVFQLCGAVTQDILLTVREMGIGICWIGNLSEKLDTINKLLEVYLSLYIIDIISLKIHSITD